MFNSVEKDDILRTLSGYAKRISKIEAMLQGAPIGTTRIADAAIVTAKIDDLAVTSAKIQSLDADKVNATTLSAIVALLGNVFVGGDGNGDGVLTVRDAENNPIIVADKDGHAYYDTEGNILVRVNVDGFHAYDISGNEIFRMNGDGLFAYGENEDVLRFRQTPASTLSYGYMGYLLHDAVYWFYISSGDAKSIFISSVSKLFLTGGADVLLASDAGDITLIAGDDVTLSAVDKIHFAGNKSDSYLFYDSNDSTYRELDMSANKEAIMPTSGGYKALFCSESPEAWFMDFCRGKKKLRSWWNPFSYGWLIYPDKLFMEVTEGPPIVIPTGAGGIVQVWRRRRGKSGVRFESRTKEQFEQNNKFWESAHD